MKIVITAGPTREHIDPVRFLSNPSTGKMGFAIAKAAIEKGCETVLIAGPVALKTPAGARRIDVVSAREMLAAAEAELEDSDERNTVFVATAAVADWRPARAAAKKLKKGEMSPVLKLKRNPDILKTISAKYRVRLVGFAAETGDPVAEAARKCREKGLEFIVANDVTAKGCGFAAATNRVTIVTRDGEELRLPMMSKLALARKIVGMILERK